MIDINSVKLYKGQDVFDNERFYIGISIEGKIQPFTIESAIKLRDNITEAFEDISND